jgi:AcrR family transcriptional regulator
MSTPAVEALDPRVERSRRVVLEATLVELGETGYGALTIEGIAARAGVGKSTIYRHWSGRLALVADAFEVLNQQPRPTTAEEREPRARVIQLLRHLSGAMQDSIFSRCLPALIDASERHPEVRSLLDAYNARRRQALVDAVAEGVSQGVFPPHVDPELAALALAGPVFYRRLLTAEPLDPARVEELVTTVLGPRR